MPGNSKSTTNGPEKLPARYLQFQKHYPEVLLACDALGKAAAKAGPLTNQVRALVKLAIAVGGPMEGAVHSHTRRARGAGCSAPEIRHVVLLGTTTLGFPTMMKALSWVDDVLKPKQWVDEIPRRLCVRASPRKRGLLFFARSQSARLHATMD